MSLSINKKLLENQLIPINIGMQLNKHKTTTSAGHRKFFFKSAVRKSATDFHFSLSATASPQLHV